MHTFVQLILLFASAPPLTGTIDGQPIPPGVLNPPRSVADAKYSAVHGKSPSESPADQREVTTYYEDFRCDSLKGQLERTARANFVRERKISATPQELAAVRQSLPSASQMIDARKRQLTLIDALQRVYDRAEQPDQVYKDLNLQAVGMDEKTWKVFLTANSKSGQRKHFAELRALPENVWLSPPSDANLEGLAIARKVNAAVDQEIRAAKSPYRSREEFWKMRRGKLRVQLNDPSYYGKCRLAEFGIVTNRSIPFPAAQK